MSISIRNSAQAIISAARRRASAAAFPLGADLM